tara:strand:- start:61 stop:609 length:549 start_codon:yes stop_codon:yes gene_type:complete
MNNKKIYIKENISNKLTKVIICGPDNVGKTNIAHALSKILNIPVYKSGREADIFHEIDAQFNVLKWGVYEQIRLIEILDVSIIFDRFFPSEYVYANVYKRNTDLDLIKKYDKWWSEIGGTIIFLDKPKMDGEDDLVKESEYSKIRKQYNDYRTITNCKSLYIDTSDHDLDKQINQILKFLGE